MTLDPETQSQRANVFSRGISAYSFSSLLGIRAEI